MADQGKQKEVVVSFCGLPHGTGLGCPEAATPGSAGLDLKAAVEQDVILPPGARACIPCGFTMALPPGYEAQIRSRSGLALKHGIQVFNAPGTIDADYRGEIRVILWNGDPAESFVVTRGMRIAQMVVAPCMAVQWSVSEALDDSGTRAGGFGSTGLA
jgi:dUTP pyrophosphatase